MAESAPILHIITPLSHVSPFDVNMAVDAGYTTIAPYSRVALSEVRDLTQDMMFSRAPQSAPRTGLFIGGKDAALALDMAAEAKASIFPPFEISIFPDPAGSFTTAAAMIAKVEQALLKTRPKGLEGVAVQVYGATGVVGSIAAVIAAQAGANVTLVSHREVAAVDEKAKDLKARFGVELATTAAVTDDEKAKLVPEAEVVLAAGKAGVEILTAAHLQAATRLLVAADVNAVPPAGIAGIGAHDAAAVLPHGIGIGALAIGNLKYAVQHTLLKQMCVTDTPLFFDLPAIFKLARELDA
ncbi:methylene-tetrahydromethanopterin dehydrogenase N-terminal domain-containing protein [Xanthobacter oligotrophicus]|uniref:methylene-tetrahydromethanopterin dehydrogenase N-terminal domain-containing protein n=1 Tax=Xanthobacter oligotrophicus TaxID=2607286 RepID=UPI0011F0D538|nr:methylene-tetrahydromethanopterin dehydrogenase N-terminal domain-containing protein [Xanthobacter oligotrophicus]MCG5237705.1 methylenetetrahydromethanopterin dehydrogenase [Xanthobacter oligotrophicus]